MIDTNKIKELISDLKQTENESYHFFENILIDLSNPNSYQDAVNRLASCYSMTQYADFNSEQEKLLSDIIENMK